MADLEYDWHKPTFTPPASIQPRVVCAAIAYPSGLCIVGARHGDMVMSQQYKLRKPGDAHHGIQGFIDQWGRFMNRTTAWKIAEAAGQIHRRCGGDDVDGGTLYSENLY